MPRLALFGGTPAQVMDKTSVLVADSQRLFSEALAITLSREPGLRVVEAVPPSMGLETVAEAIRHKANVVLVDYWMHGMQGPAVTASIKSRLEAAKVLVLSSFWTPTQAGYAMAAGATGLLSKDVGAREVALCIERAVLEQGPIYSSDLEHQFTGEFGESRLAAAGAIDDVWGRLGLLSRREIQLLEWLSSTGSLEATAKALRIKTRTARSHLENIREKTGIRSQKAILAAAQQRGFIQHGSVTPTVRAKQLDGAPRGKHRGRGGKLLVCDAQRLFSDALATALAAGFGFDVDPERPRSTEEALEAATKAPPDAVVMDYWMPQLGGPEATRRILALEPNTKVILTSWCHNPHYISRSVAAGAAGFVPKSIGVEELAGGISRAMAGEPLVFGDRLAAFAERLDRLNIEGDQVAAGFLELTPRQIEVLTGLASGYSVGEIGARLGIRSGTVNVHVHTILMKTGTRSAAQAVALAQRCGLLRLTPSSAQIDVMPHGTVL